MLVRSAGRRQRDHAARVLAASFAQLNLPWLAPAQCRWSATYGDSSVRSCHKTREPSLLGKYSSRSQTRPLATAAAPERFDNTYHASTYDNAFQTPSQSARSPWQLPTGVHTHPANLSAPSPGSKPHTPVIINTSMRAPEPLIRVGNMVSGTTIELLQYLRTSLQVGRKSRAEAILQRLAATQSASSPELAYAHGVYLESILEAVYEAGKSAEGVQKYQEMHTWFEDEVRRKGATVTAKMLVTVIRGTIAALETSQRELRIKEYVDLAHRLGDEIYDEVLFSEEYDDEEFTILGAITSPYHKIDFDPPVPDPELDAIVEKMVEQYRRPDVLPLEALPEVRGTKVKGDTLEEVQQTANALRQHPSLPVTAPIDDQRAVALERQNKVEETSVQVAIERWRKADEEMRKFGINPSMKSKPVAALMWQWYRALLPELEKERAECIKLMNKPVQKDPADRLTYAPFLEMLPLEKIAATTILQMVTTIVGQKAADERQHLEMKVGFLTTVVADAIENESFIDAAGLPGLRGKKVKTTSAHRLRRSLHRQLKLRQKAPETSSRDANETVSTAVMEWPTVGKVKLGAMLLDKIIGCALISVTKKHPHTGDTITQMQPAFLHKIKYVKGKRAGVIALNQALVELLRVEPVGSTIAKRLPMIVEPRPWTSWSDGAYLRYPTSIMRLGDGDKSGKEYFNAAHEQNDLNQIYDGLNALSKVPWKIHHGVFQVQLEAWNSGEAIANIPALNPKLDIPPEPPRTSDPIFRRKWLNEMRAVENKRSGLHSQRCFMNLQLEVARALVNDTLYFPHNLDFRGRAYPIPPYLNHMGADNVRGLLVFAKGKPLGEKGLRWLKIHLATAAGHDKASLSERVEFTEEHLDDIYDSARNPLGGRRWWLKAEDAWQTLAACFELTAALDSPDPTQFISHLPVQQDGTCNGLQHYAALGGDKVGAAQVNLEPSDRPSDVYSAVLRAVEEAIRRDSLAGDPIAKKLEGRINRKCVKQPVMTNVYGVTWFGAKEQVRKQLKTLFPEVRGSDGINHTDMSIYIAKHIFGSLEHMFGGAQAIQRWLGQCADRISVSVSPDQVDHFVAKFDEPARTMKSSATQSGLKGRKSGKSNNELPQFKSAVIWTTPLRLPVVQPYRAESRLSIKTKMQLIDLKDPHVWNAVSKRKQLQAFPPNFIHSLDATHMLLSALKCTEAGMTFASIHDSFWCHAADVDNMGRMLRDAFVTMHKEDIVGRLREEFVTRYRGYLYVSTIFRNSEAGEKVMEWRKANGVSVAKASSLELKLEGERARLLRSSNPEDQAKGKAMVTPCSIVEEFGDTEAEPLAPSITPTLGLGPEDQKDVVVPEGSEHDVYQADSDEMHADAITGEYEVFDSNTDADADHDQDHDHASLVEDAAPNNQEDQEVGEIQPGEPTQRAKRAKAKAKAQSKLHIWMPLTFPPVPPKGDFDVSRLKDSQYFFH